MRDQNIEHPPPIEMYFFYQTLLLECIITIWLSSFDIRNDLLRNGLQGVSYYMAV